MAVRLKKRYLALGFLLLIGGLVYVVLRDESRPDVSDLLLERKSVPAAENVWERLQRPDAQTNFPDWDSDEDYRDVVKAFYARHEGESVGPRELIVPMGEYFDVSVAAKVVAANRTVFQASEEALDAPYFQCAELGGVREEMGSLRVARLVRALGVRSRWHYENGREPDAVSDAASMIFLARRLLLAKGSTRSFSFGCLAEREGLAMLRWLMSRIEVDAALLNGLTEGLAENVPDAEAVVVMAKNEVAAFQEFVKEYQSRERGIVYSVGVNGTDEGGSRRGDDSLAKRGYRESDRDEPTFLLYF